LAVKNFVATNNQWKSWYTARSLCFNKNLKRNCTISTEIPNLGVCCKIVSKWTSEVGQRNPTPTPSVVRNPTPNPPKNLPLRNPAANNAACRVCLPSVNVGMKWRCSWDLRTFSYFQSLFAFRTGVFGEDGVTIRRGLDGSSFNLRCICAMSKNILAYNFLHRRRQDFDEQNFNQVRLAVKNTLKTCWFS